MTATTIAEPRSRTSGGGADAPPVRPASGRRRDAVSHRPNDALTSELVAALTLTLYSLAVAGGFTRVFTGWDFFDDLAVIVIVGHGSAFLLRRASAPIWVALPAAAALLAWLIGFIYLRETYSYLLPTDDTWALARLELDLIGEQFSTTVAPVAHIGGWALLAAAGTALAVLLADAFAFRAFARAEALVPGGVLFVFVAALGSDRARVASTGLLIATGVVATITLRAHHAPRAAVVVASHAGRPSAPNALLVAPTAVATALVVSIAAVAVGPRVPGAESEALYDHTNSASGGSLTEVVSPLVDIRSRLTNRSPTELFQVTATAPAYWRLSALPEFDGNTWGLPERQLERADGDLTDAPDGTVEIRQTIAIAALGGPLVPAAASPIAADGADGLRWNSDSATLVKTGEGLIEGDTFEILSAAPRFDPAVLAGATSRDPGDDLYLELPDGFPRAVIDTAEQLLGDAGSSYEAARILQDWFRSEFTYSLEAPAGHSTTAVEAFLVNRVGYCEQFAGTYAAMMRSVGIPARVAVGFTPGQAVTAAPDGASTFSVVGRNAHAWPEVWFDELGWVPFEPTPGRGAPGAEAYTGLEAAQDESPLDDPAPAGSGDGADAPAPAPTVPADPDRVPPGANFDEFVPGLDAGATTVEATSGEGDGGSFPRLLVVIVLVGLFALVPMAIRRWRRRPADDQRVELARLWRRAVRSLEDVGVHLRPDLTPTEAAAATTEAFPMAARPLAALASAVTEASFRPDPDEVLSRTGSFGMTTIEQCGVWIRQIEKAVADSSTPWMRIRRFVTRWE